VPPAACWDTPVPCSGLQKNSLRQQARGKQHGAKARATRGPRMDHWQDHDTKTQFPLRNAVKKSEPPLASAKPRRLFSQLAAARQPGSPCSLRPRRTADKQRRRTVRERTAGNSGFVAGRKRTSACSPFRQANPGREVRGERCTKPPGPTTRQPHPLADVLISSLIRKT
jgi:hypothetical protein